MNIFILVSLTKDVHHVRRISIFGLFTPLNTTEYTLLTIHGLALFYLDRFYLAVIK